MFQLRNIFIFLLLTNINGNPYKLDILIQRISKEMGTFTILLFGSDKHQLNEILLTIPNVPVMVATSFSKDFHPNPGFKQNVLFMPVVKENDIKEKYLSEMEKAMQSITVRRFVVVICEHNDPQMKEYLAWMYKWKFPRIFAFTGNRTFAYFPYAGDKIHQVADNGPLPHAMRNLNGFTIRTNLQMEAPRAFSYTDKHGRRVFAGYSANMFFGFIRKHNATYIEVPLNTSSDYDIPVVIKATINGEIDICMNPYLRMPSIQLSYPFKFLRWTILIPHNEYIDPNEYFTRPFSPTVWGFIAMMTVYISLLDIGMNSFLKLKIDPWQSFSRTLCIFLNLSSERRIERAFRFHAQVLLTAFILSNLYSVHLTSFLTVFIKAKQAYTLQDLIDFKFRILVIDTEVILMPLVNLPPGIEKIVIGVPVRDLDKDRFSVQNKSFAYAAPSDKAMYILSQQVKLKHPNFHISSDSMMDVNFGLMVAQDSPFLDILDTYVVEQLDMGLMVKWESDAYYHGREAGVVRLLNHTADQLVPFSLSHLSFAWNCLGLGLVGASLIFLMEICISRSKFVNQKRE